MHILIAGAGTVGSMLAKHLSLNHSVVVVDKNRQKLARLEEDNDILTICGDIENPRTYRTLDIDRVDLFIAVSDSDEANLLSTLVIEDVVEVKRKAVRLKNDAFVTSHVLEKLRIDHAVYPDIITTNKIKALLTFPKANNVKLFHQTDYRLISIRVDAPEYEAVVTDLQCDTLHIVGIERQKRFFIPNEDDKVVCGDLVYCFGLKNSIERLADAMAVTMPSIIRKAVLFGANALGVRIAKMMHHEGIETVLVDRSYDACVKAADALEGKVRVMHSRYDDKRLFKEEGLSYADIAVCVDKNDETNIIKSLEAKEFGIPKTVGLNNDSVYYDLMHTLGIVVVRGSKAGAYYAVTELIASSHVATQRRFCGGRGILAMRKIYADSTLVGKTAAPLRDKHIRLLLVRKGCVIRWKDQTVLEKEDIIVAIGNENHAEKLMRWIETIS